MRFLRFVAEGLWEGWNDAKPDRMAAALAFFSMFSFVPLLYIALTVAGWFLNDAAVVRQIYVQLARTLGLETTQFIQDLLVRTAQQSSGQSWLATLVSILVLLYIASGLFAALEDMLNIIWKNPFPAHQGLFAILRVQLLAFVMVLGVGLLFIGLTVASFFVEWLGAALHLETALIALNGLILFGVTVTSFALIYHVLARTKLRWRAVWAGAFGGAILFSIGKWFFGLYLTIANLGSAFAAASVLAILLLAIYYAAICFLLGALLVRVLPAAYAKTKAAA